MRRALVVAALAVLLAAGCRQDMHDQPRIKPQGPNPFFPDGRGGRPLVDGTVPRTAALDAAAMLTGKEGTQFVAKAPIALTPAVLARGRQRYDIFCSPCHDRVGTGQGMIVQRGYKRPPSFHIERLRAESDGYFFSAITNGFGVMPNYAQQIPVADRWAIALYVRALQLSQTATMTDVPETERAKLIAGESR